METKCLLQLLKEKGYIEFASNMDLDKWHIKKITCEEEIITDKIISNLEENLEYGEKFYFTRYENIVYIIHKEGFLEEFKNKFMENQEKMKGPLSIPIHRNILHSELIDILRDNGYIVSYYGNNMSGARLYEVIDIKKREERIEKENNRKQEIEDFINNLP